MMKVLQRLFYILGPRRWFVVRLRGTPELSSRTGASKPTRDETNRVLRAVAGRRPEIPIIHPESFSPDGSTVDKTYEFAIESRKRTIRADKRIPHAQVRELTLPREAQQELKLR